MPTCDEIKEAVREYNGENSANDLALTSAREAIQNVAIQNVPPSEGRFLAEVCLVAD